MKSEIFYKRGWIKRYFYTRGDIAETARAWAKTLDIDLTDFSLGTCFKDCTRNGFLSNDPLNALMFFKRQQHFGTSLYFTAFHDLIIFPPVP